MTSTLMRKTGGKKILGIALASAFWLAVWHLASVLVGETLFLASPGEVLASFWRLLGTRSFYETVGNSFGNIAIGFFSSLIIGCGCAVIAYKFKSFETLLIPFMGVAKSAPAASFTMVFLLMVGSKNMAVPVVFIMALPLFYSNLLAGLKSVDPERFEAAEVFGMVRNDRFRFIFLPYIAPFFASACEVGWGMAWKAGVSAEVIAITAHSIGGEIYSAKIFLETKELFAYTLVVIVISLALERLTVRLVRFAEYLMTRPREMK